MHVLVLKNEAVVCHIIIIIITIIMRLYVYCVYKDGLIKLRMKCFYAPATIDKNLSFLFSIPVLT